MSYAPRGFFPSGGRTKLFQVLANTSFSVGPLDFVPAAVGVDNPTPFYIHFPEGGFGSWVQPYTLGAVVPAPALGRSFMVNSNEVPPPGIYAAVATTLIATCLAFEDPQPYSPGYQINLTNPNQTPSKSAVFNGPASGTTLVIAIANQRVYAHTFACIIDAGVAGAIFSLESPAGTTFGRFNASQVGPHYMDFKGLPQPVGAAVVITFSAPMNLRGTLLYNQAP